MTQSNTRVYAKPLPPAKSWDEISNDPAPLSRWLGLPVLLNSPAPLSEKLGWGALTDNAAPLSRRFGWLTLLNDPAPLSRRLGIPVLISDSAPLSHQLGLPVLKRKDSSSTTGKQVAALSGQSATSARSDDPAPLSQAPGAPVPTGEAALKP